MDVSGAASTTSTVTVALNGGTPQSTTRQGELYFKQLTVDNSAAAQRPSLTITGVKNLVGPGGEDAVTAITKTSYLPKTPEVFTYDADGNLISDAMPSAIRPCGPPVRASPQEKSAGKPELLQLSRPAVAGSCN